MSTPELLQEIRDRLGDLPGRLALILGTSRTRNEKGQITSGSDTSKAPGLWNSTERLAGAMGRVVPLFGELAHAMGTLREIHSAANQFGAAWRGTGSPSLGQGQPRLLPQSTPAPAIASVPTATWAPTAAPALAQSGAMPSLAPSRGGGSSPLFESLFQQLMLEIRKNTEMLRQQEPDETEDTERLPAGEIGEGPNEDKLPVILHETEKKTISEFIGPMRPEKPVPSSKGGKDGGASGVGEFVAGFIKAFAG